MDFLSGLAKGDKSKPTSDEHNQSSDIFSSAKVVAEAAQAQFNNQPEKVDKAKAAAAAADIIDAAGKYGKLDETKGVGKYVEQAEDYLRKYDTSGQAATHTPAGDSAGEKTAATHTPTGDSAGEKTAVTGDSVTTTETEKPSGGAEDYIKKAEGFLEKPSAGGEGGGAEDYIKKAEGFLKKPEGEKSEASPESGGGYGNLTKMAGGFFSK